MGESGNLFPIHRFDHQRQDLAIIVTDRHQEIGSVEIQPVDIVPADKAFDRQDLVAFGDYRGELVALHDEVLTIVQQVAFDLIVPLHGLSGLAVDELALDAIAGLAIDDVE